MIAAASRLVALPAEGESLAAVEAQKAVELLQTAVPKQAAYSYSRERVHSTPHYNRSYSRRIESPAVSSSERRRNPPHGYNSPRDDNNVQALLNQARERQEAELAAQLAAHQ